MFLAVALRSELGVALMAANGVKLKSDTDRSESVKMEISNLVLKLRPVQPYLTGIITSMIR